MIGLLTGVVAGVEADRCLIDVAGVGYVVSASTQTLASLPEPPERVRLLIETVVREESIQLYGFRTADEQEWFRLLTTVQGVGAKVALAILSVATPGDLVLSIGAGDKTTLTRAAGVGARLAERIVTELRNKVGKMPGGGAAPLGKAAGLAAHSIENDALQALAGLGFRRAEAWPVLGRILTEHEGAGLDTVIRLALKDLAR
ncbi:Holliday junction branch migration protein RuvA [Swaminathania salitolerans]|uniref:Holliday junction branch migration complex subunit RuvA n=1 Tax=Swaminathania salitolerans TaxID=182838 RepID=A0A511BLZ6_9PROT|nr:Holliday junction branch migration protein RuvA [Swaminathania salitolerans]GBQ15456.1 Holliday junction DNA helicase RuvA [Swaminathania salitolerans LMG 21291]GEL01360.1 Holliday junction ATP-dependent DNA helicase RuvA [Swaminathania salitolerans]